MHKHLIKINNKHKNRIPVLMYHEVSEIPERKKEIRNIHPCYSLQVRQFQEQIEYLFRNNYKSLSLSSLFKKNYNFEKGVVITFDDGLIGNYEFAFPVLRKCDFTATIFIIVNRVSSEGYMNWEQLSELSKNGISIQSHTMTHQPLEQLTDEEVYYELSESKRIIEEKLGTSVNYLGLPHGSMNNNIVPIAKEIGYLGICSSTIKFADSINHSFVIGRIPIKERHGIKTFKRIIFQNNIMILKFKLAALLTNSLRNIMGLDNYRKFYRFIFRIKTRS